MLSNDYLIERFHLKKSINKWKFISLSLCIVFAFIFFLKNNPGNSSYIARVHLNGILSQNQEVNNSLKNIQDNNPY